MGLFAPETFFRRAPVGAVPVFLVRQLFAALSVSDAERLGNHAFRNDIHHLGVRRPYVFLFISIFAFIRCLLI